MLSAWFAFFISFCSTFMAAPLMPIIRDDLNLTATQSGNAASASIARTVAARILMGSLCDTIGPRKAYGVLMLLTALPCFAMTVVTTYAEFLICRCLIGFSLASFVGTQYWSSTMFTPKIVGGANAITGGWGNLGGGVTQIVTPIMAGFFLHYGSAFRAWRQCFFTPGLLHLLCGMSILILGIDSPDGNYAALAKSGARKADTAEAMRNFKAGIFNYRMWVFVLTYGFCFGVELVVDNVLAGYFYSQFDLKLTEAGLIASYSGLMNVCSRALGGIVSDLAAKRFGMRGRLWTLWFLQTASGGVCVAFGMCYESLDNSIATMIIFSFLTQMSCGATYGIVPFISKRALGVVSGFVGAGGNTIAAIVQYVFFTHTSVWVEIAIRNLGIVIMAFTVPVALVHFPQWGSMFFGPRKNAIDEEEYYTREYSAQEKEEGRDGAAKKFAKEAMGERGSKHGSSAALNALDVKADAVAAKA